MKDQMKMKLKTILFTILICLLPFGMQAQVGVGGNSEINQCETNTYTISVTNSSGGPLTGLVITAHMVNLNGFTYVPGSTVIGIGGPFCAANPVPSGSDLIWNIDLGCAGTTTLNNGATLDISFQLATDCDAVSGSLNVTFDSNETAPDGTGVLNIKVNPGAIIIRKELTVIPQVFLGTATWTLTVENTGFGVIENVFITDVLGAGLTYVSSTESGNNAGQTTTWSSAEYPALVSMNPGDTLTMQITAQVTDCNNLDNTADARFGCIPGAGNACYDTSIDGGTARASVQRIVRTPDIVFTPLPINFTYCDDTQNVAFTITNNGDGIAFQVWTLVDLSQFTVSNVSAGATYNAGQNRFELTDPLAALGGNYNLSFDLTFNTWCGGSFPTGDLLWQKLYEDECGQEFYPPVELSTISAPTNTSSLAVAKTGAPSQIEIGGSITYNVTSSYTGQLNCDSPSNPTGTITVVDTLPAGLVPTSYPGAVWDPGPRTLTWTYLPPATLNANYTVDVPDVTQCETYCNTIFTNTVNATGTDCCGCALNASASQTTAIECAEGVTSDKTSSSPTERCYDTTYTNTYVFSGGSVVNLNDLVFTEEAELNQQYVGASLSINLSGSGDITGSAAITDNTPTGGGNGLILDFTGAAATPLAGQTLTITYDLTATAATLTACTNNTFYSWSSLSMGTAGSLCLTDGIIHETTVVSLGTPGMSVDVTGLGLIYNTCETQTITVTFTQTTDYNPKDVQLVLSGLNYFVVNPGTIGCGGSVAPVACTPVMDGDDYVWTFNDAFTANGVNAVFTIDVQKRCSGGSALTATGYFDDACTDDATIDELCSVTGSDTPVLLLIGDLLIEKTPETYYATTNTVVWEIYVTNRGTGTAYNVWVDDVLGSGLQYNHGAAPAIVDDMTGVTVNDSLDHLGGAINGASIEILEMAAGERRQITFTATQINCTGLTNDVTTNWGCINIDCQPDVTDSSIVQIPAPNLINTNTITPVNGINACEDPRGFITLKNAGQIFTYNLQVTETLPAGLTYVPGSTRWRATVGGVVGAWNGPNAAFDPSPTTSPLVWTSTEIPQLASAAPGDIIEIEFDMVSNCPFAGGNINVATQYENPCATVFNTSDSTFTVTFIEPDISITKVLDPDQPIGCNQIIFWDITVTNNSSDTLEILWLEDTLDAAFTYTATTITSGGAYIDDTGNNVGQVVTYEIHDLPSGQSVVLRMEAVTDQAADPCNANTDNTVLAWWGCGNPDGSSTTKPGVDAPDAGLCLGAATVSATSSETRQPTVAYLALGVSPSDIDTCDDSTTLTVTIENTGPTDARNVDLVLTLPPGLTYIGGSTEIGLSTTQANAIATLGTGGTNDPISVGNVLTWYNINDTPAGKADDLADTLERDDGGANVTNDTLVLRFDVRSDCYVTDNLDFDLYYYDCCDDTQYSTSSSPSLTAIIPTLVVTKVANASPVNCNNGQQNWTITVRNTGSVDADVVLIEDTLGPWFTVDIPSSTAGLAAMPATGANVYGWEFGPLAPGATATFTLYANYNASAYPPNANSCDSTLRRNRVRARWGCGAFNSDPNDTTDWTCDTGPWTSYVDVTEPMADISISSVTPNAISCTADGTMAGTVTVRVSNTGSANATGLVVRLASDCGYNFADQTNINLNAGASTNLTFNYTPNCTNCTCIFTATADPSNGICECNETNNSRDSASFTPSTYDLTVNSDTLIVGCSGTDGEVTVSGAIVIANDGCADLTTDFDVTFTLYDSTGCEGGTGSIVRNWTETVTGQINASGTLSYTIQNGTFTSNLCITSDLSIRVQLDTGNDVCECDGTNNNYCADNISRIIPDLIVTNIDYTNVSCTNDNVSGFVRVTVQNQGYGSASNFDVQLATDGCLNFATNQTVVGPLTNGQTAFVDFPIVTAWTNPNDCACDFTATVDIDDDVCECNGSNNTLTTTYNNPLPNLRVTSVVPSFNCVSDGSLTGNVAVTVNNNGCAAAAAVDVQLTTPGNVYAFTNQSITLAAGATQVLNFSFTPIAANCDVDFTATIDPGAGAGTVCESTNTDNTVTYSNFAPDIPDLSVQSDTLILSCNNDGVIAVNGNLVVSNSGCGSFTDDIPVRLTLYDGTGCTGTELGTWTETLGSVNINGGNSQAFTISELIDTNILPSRSANCTLSIGVELDYTGSGFEICEFDGTNNTYCANNKAKNIPDIEVSTAVLAVSCLSDGNIAVSGNVTLVNNGCGPDMGDNIPMRFTLYDNTGCSGNIIGTWTDTFSNPVPSIPSGGGTQTFNISGQSYTTNAFRSSNNCQASIRIEADYTGSGFEICENDGANNSYCADGIDVHIPDVQVQSDTLSVDCNSSTEVTVSGNVTLTNSGCGSNLNADIPVRFTMYDNVNCTGNPVEQWVETFSSINIPAGNGTQTVIMNPVTFNFLAASDSTNCQVSIRIEADYTGSGFEICESDGSNNELCSDKTVNIPDLTINSVGTTVTCLSDGNLTGTTVSVSNIGCGPAVGVVVRLASDCGLTFTDQNVDIASGATVDVFFPFEQKITGCTCSLTGTIDPDNLICESDDSNNIMSSTTTMSIPDLEVSGNNTVNGNNIRIACADDGKVRISGSVGISNSGCGAAFSGSIPTRFSLYSGRNGSGKKILEWTDDINGGSIAPGRTVSYRLTDQVLDLDIINNSDNGWFSVEIELDYNNSICEWDGTNNDFLLDKQTEFVDLIIDDIEYICNPDNSVSFVVTVSNTGTQSVSGVFLEIINADNTTNQLIDLPAGSTKTYNFKTKVYTNAIDTTISFTIDSANSFCETNGDNNSKDIHIYCVPPGTPKIELSKICPKADKPGGIFRFEVRLKNTGDGDARDVSIDDILPEKFQYVTGTTIINGVRANDPSGTTSLKWIIGDLKKGEELLLTYNAITDSDIKEGRYCNQAYSFGRTLDNKEVASDQVSCCTIVTRNKEGCCLRIETDGRGYYKIPEMPVAYFKPYFFTEDAMYLSYSALQFYKMEKNQDVKDDKVEFIRERLKNYALSTIEEFYFNSNMGIEGLKFSYGGSYPVTNEKGWEREGADKTMTLSQIAFEMLALNEAVLVKNMSVNEKLKKILDGKIDFIHELEIARKNDGKDFYPHSWQVGDEKLEESEKKSDLYDKTVLYFSVNSLIESGYKELIDVSDWLGKNIKKFIKKKKNKYKGKEELFYILGLAKAGKTKLSKKRLKRFNKLVEDKTMDINSLDISALALYSNLNFEGDRGDEFYSFIIKKYYNKNIGIFAETLPDLTYKIDQRQLGSLILSMGKMKGDRQKQLSSDIYRMIDETGLFLNKRHSSASFVPVNLIKNSSFMDQNVPIISTLKLNKNTAPVFSRDVRIYPSITNRIEESVVFPNYSKVFSPSYEDDSVRILSHSYSLQYIGGNIKNNKKRVISERGRTLENIGQKYLEFMLDSKGGLFYGNKLIVPFSKISVKGRVTDQLSIEPLSLSTDYSTESFANLFVAENIYIKNKGKKEKVLSETVQIQKKIIAEFVKIGYVPEKFKLYIGSGFEKDGAIKIIPSKEQADKITIIKLLSGFDVPETGKLIENGKTKKLKSEDLIFLSLFPKYKTFFENELEEISTTFARDITQKSASAIANRILGKTEGKYISDIKKFWEKDVQLPVGRIDKMKMGENRIVYDIQQYLLFLSALKKDGGFIFNRSLDYFSYILEGEWGITKNNRILAAPPKEIILIKETPRNYPEPGDIFSKAVRIYNRCLESYQGSRYFDNLFIWTKFTTPLLYYGSEKKDDLTHLEGFKWKFKGMSEGGYLSFIYQALIPANFKENNIKWQTFVSSVDRSEDINYGDKLDRCEDDHMGEGIFIRPLTEIKGIVYEDLNINGRRDVGEIGLTGIIIKDSLGRSLITDKNGEFRVKTGSDKLVVQMDMQSLPANLTLTTSPTEVVNNVFEHNISFGVVDCINIRGFVYDDLNGNGSFDSEEPKFGGIFIKTRKKEVVSDKNGYFEISNLPKSWKKELKIQKNQQFTDIKGKNLKLFIEE